MKKNLLINLLLLMLNGFQSKPAAPSPPSSSALHDAIDKLSIVARVTNAITIQKGLNDKSMKVDNLLDELLNISPGDGFSYLQSLDVKKAKEGYIGIAKDAGALTKSSLDGAKNAQRLKHLGDMGKNVEMLKKAKDADLKDAIDKAEGALSFPAEDIPSSIETYSNSLNVFFELEWKSADADKKIIDSIPNLQEKLDPLGIILSGAPNFETKLKSIWSFINQSQNFNIVEHLGEVVEPYVNSFSEIKKLTGDFKNMKNEFLATIPLFKQSSLLNSIEESISKSLKIVLIASSNSTSSHSLTSGFLNRIKDVQAVKDDLKSDWFVEKIAVNDQKSLDILKEYLSAFDRMSSQIVEIGATFTSLQPSAKSINSVNTSTILFSSQKDVSPVELEKLQKSVSEVGGCIDKLLETTMKVNFDEFRDTIRNLKQLDVAANQTKSLIKKIADLNVYGDGKVFKSLLADIKKINATASIAITKGQIDAMRANETYKKFAEKVATASKYFDEIKQTGTSILIRDTNKNMSIIKNMQDVLKRTNLITTLECLKDKKFDSSLASDLMKFGSNIRAFGVHAKNDKATISFLDQISKLQNLYFSVKKSLDEKRTRRATGSIDPAKLPNLLASQDLGKGLNLLRQLSKVYDKKNVVSTAASSTDPVFAEVQKILRTTDALSLKLELKKMLLNLASLESFANNHTGQGLRELGAIFEKASEVSGVTVNSSLLEDPVAKTLSTSAVNDIKKAAPSFKTLGSLKLNYANHRSTFKGASLSIVKIDEFFSDFFAAGGNIESEDSVLVYAAISIGGVLLITIGAVAGYFIWRHIQEKKIQNDPNYSRHNGLTIQNQIRVPGPNDYNRNRYIKLHEAIREKNYETFKRCVDEGADVNAFGGDYEFFTPLHMAVQEGLPNFVEYLIRNGADVNKIDSNYQLPIELAGKVEKRDELLAVFNKFKGKKFPRKFPKFGPENYKVWCYVNELDKDETSEYYISRTEFSKLYAGNVVRKVEDATHIVLPENENGSVTFDYTKDFDFYKMIAYFFKKTVVMKSSWLKASIKDRKNFVDDYKFQVEEVCMNSTSFKTCRQIHRHVQESRIPYLTGVKVHLHLFKKIKKDLSKFIKDLLSELGCFVYTTGTLPHLLDPDYAATNDKNFPSMYHRDDIGPHIIVTPSEDLLWKKCDFVFHNNRFLIVSPTELIEFLFEFKINHYKITGKKEKTCIEKWDSVDQNIATRKKQKKPTEKLDRIEKIFGVNLGDYDGDDDVLLP